MGPTSRSISLPEILLPARSAQRRARATSLPEAVRSRLPAPALAQPEAQEEPVSTDVGLDMGDDSGVCQRLLHVVALSEGELAIEPQRSKVVDVEGLGRLLSGRQAQSRLLVEQSGPR